MTQNSLLVESQLCVKPTVSETSRTLDLSCILHKLNTYLKSAYIDTGFVLDDLSLVIRFFPNGDQQPNPRAVIYLGVHTCAATDCRNIYFSMECGPIKSQLVKPVNQFKLSGWYLPHSHIHQCPVLKFILKITHNPSFVQTIPSHSFIQQHQRMHELSQLYGDITLKVKLHQENDDILYSPPNKRMRLNQEYECKVCNQTFSSNKALQTHQNNKKDEAHNCCNHKDSDNLDLNDNDEIKISSVILRSSSKVFDRMLDTNMMEKGQKTIEIHAKCVEDVKDLAYFMSTNILKINSNPFHLIELAHFYTMGRLFWECVNRIISNINVQNFGKSVNIFTKYEIDHGYDSLVKFAKKNVDEIKKAPDFEKIPFIFKRLVFSK